MPKYWGGGEVKRNIYDKLGADYHVPQKQEFMRYAPGGHIVTNPNDAYNGMMPNYDSGNFVGEDTVSDTAPITTDATSVNNYTLTGNGDSNTQPTGSKFTGNYNYMIPAAQIAGDVGMLAMQRKMQPQPITAPPITPQQINLAPQRAQIQAQGMAAQRSNQMAMRNAGLNPVQYMSAVGAGNADVNRNTNEALLQSGLAEQQYNVGTANQFAGINAQRKTQADMYNAQMKNYYNQQRLGLMSDIAAVPARGMSNAQDIRQRTMSAEMNNPYYNVTNSPNNNLWTTLTGNNQYNLQVSPYGQNFSRGNGGTLGEYQKYIQSYNPYNKKCIGGQLGRGGKLKQIMVTR